MYQLKWLRWKSCQVIRDESGGLIWICPPARKLGKKVPHYDPFSVSALPTELARVNQAVNLLYGKHRERWLEKKIPQTGETAVYRPIVAFVETFGPLGFTALQGERTRVTLEGKKQLIDGDRIDWFLAHAGNVSLVLGLQGALAAFGAYGEPPQKAPVRENALATLKRILGQEAQVKLPVKVGLGRFRATAPRSHPPRIPTTSAPWYVPMEAKRLRVIQKHLQQQNRRQIADAGKLLLAELFNPNLGSVRRTFDPKSGSSVFHFRALIEAIYWQIADKGKALRQCEECGLWFFPNDARRKFCPNPTSGRESKCGKRNFMRKLRTAAY